MVGVVSGQHITISTTLLTNFDVCQKIFIRGTSCFGFEAEPHTRAPQAKMLGVYDVTEAIFVKDYVILDHQILKISAAGPTP